MIRTVSSDRKICIPEFILERLQHQELFYIYESNGAILIRSEVFSANMYSIAPITEGTIQFPEDILMKCQISVGEKVSVTYYYDYDTSSIKVSKL